MRPRRRSAMPGRTARQKFAAPVRLVEMTVSHSCAVILRKGFQRKTPALLTRMSTGPSSVSIFETQAAAASGSVMSVGMARQAPFDFSILEAVSSRPFSLLETRATRAPSSANRCATERPMPRLAPVTMTVRPRIFMPRSLWDVPGVYDRPMKAMWMRGAAAAAGFLAAMAGAAADRDAKADKVGKEMIASLGGEQAWEKAREFKFDFVVENEGKVAGR